MKSFFLFSASLVIVALVIGFSINHFREKPLPFMCKNKEERLGEAVERIQARENAKAILDTLPEELDFVAMKEIVESGEAIILDARPELFHRLGHIASALSLPRDDFERGYMALKDKLQDKSQAIIIYCADSNCEESKLVAAALRKLGHSNIAIYSGGWREWEKK